MSKRIESLKTRSNLAYKIVNYMKDDDLYIYNMCFPNDTKAFDECFNILGTENGIKKLRMLFKYDITNYKICADGSLEYEEKLNYNNKIKSAKSLLYDVNNYCKNYIRKKGGKEL